MRADASAGELTVRTDPNSCAYVITASELLNVITNDRWARRRDPETGFLEDKNPELPGDGSVYENGCHLSNEYHEHRFEDFYRLEMNTVYLMPYIEVAVTYCNCHVLFPVGLVLRLFSKAEEWTDGSPIAEIGQDELERWYKNAEEYEAGFRCMGWHWRREAKSRGEESLILY